MRCALPLLTLVALCTACGGPGSQRPADHVGADAMARQAVEAASAALDQALRTNDAEALFTHVADDVVLMPPGEAPVRGSAAMRGWYARFLSQFRTSSLTLTDREVFVGEGWAVVKGSYEWGLKATAGGDPLIDRGSYVQIWTRQPNGGWLFSREIWNSSVPPPAP